MIAETIARKSYNFFKIGRLALSGALLGVAAANGFIGVDHTGELLAGAAGFGGALLLMKFTAII